MNRMFTILLVEDEPTVQFVMREALHDAGHAVTVVATVDDGFDALSRVHGYHVVLLDLRLGMERGEDIFTRLILQHIAYPPVVILSAQPEWDSRQAMQRIAAHCVLTKPASMVEITTAMEAAVAA